MAPMHKGVAGVANLNLQLQGALNGAGRGSGRSRASSAGATR
jgi:ATP-dependent exoDNAse (exonuclease V) alpha subunit